MERNEAKQIIESIHSGTSTIMLEETNETIQNNLLRDCEALQIAENLFEENDKLKAEIEELNSKIKEMTERHKDEMNRRIYYFEENSKLQKKTYNSLLGAELEIEQLKAELEQKNRKEL